MLLLLSCLAIQLQHKLPRALDLATPFISVAVTFNTTPLPLAQSLVARLKMGYYYFDRLGWIQGDNYYGL